MPDATFRVCKLPIGGRRYLAVVQNTNTREIVFRSQYGWNKKGKTACASWIATSAVGS